jgi:hypothetical protein
MNTIQEPESLYLREDAAIEPSATAGKDEVKPRVLEQGESSNETDQILAGL